MTTLVLVHAFPLTSAMWDDVRGRLTDTVRVLAPNLAGFGGRPVPAEQPDVDVFADDLAEWITESNVAPVVLCGLSLGGYVSMAFLRRHRELLAGLILADTKATADPEPARENRERIAQRVLAEGSDVLLEDVVPGLCGPTTSRTRPEVVQRVRSLAASANPAAVAWAQRAMAGRPDSVADLESLGLPSVVIRGDEDQLSSATDAETMADALGGVPIRTIEGVGHLSAMEDPQAFATAVTAFLHASGLAR